VDEKKSNSKLKDINCSVCGYNGEPKLDGRCPSCGAIGGQTPYEPVDRNKNKEYSRSESSAEYQKEVQKALREKFTFLNIW